MPSKDLPSDPSRMVKRKVKARSLARQKTSSVAPHQANSSLNTSITANIYDTALAPCALSADILALNRLQRTQDVDALLATAHDPEEQVILTQTLHRDDADLFGDNMQPDLLDLANALHGDNLAGDDTRRQDNASASPQDSPQFPLTAYLKPITFTPPPLVIPHYAPHSPRPPLPLLSEALARIVHMQHLFRHAYADAIPHAAELAVPHTARVLEAWLTLERTRLTHAFARQLAVAATLPSPAPATASPRVLSPRAQRTQPLPMPPPLTPLWPPMPPTPVLPGVSAVAAAKLPTVSPPAPPSAAAGVPSPAASTPLPPRPTHTPYSAARRASVSRRSSLSLPPPRPFPPHALTLAHMLTALYQPWLLAVTSRIFLLAAHAQSDASSVGLRTLPLTHFAALLLRAHLALSHHTCACVTGERPPTDPPPARSDPASPRARRPQRPVLPGAHPGAHPAGCVSAATARAVVRLAVLFAGGRAHVDVWAVHVALWALACVWTQPQLRSSSHWHMYGAEDTHLQNSHEARNTFPARVSPPRAARDVAAAREVVVGVGADTSPLSEDLWLSAAVATPVAGTGATVLTGPRGAADSSGALGPLAAPPDPTSEESATGDTAACFTAVLRACSCPEPHAGEDRRGSTSGRRASGSGSGSARRSSVCVTGGARNTRGGANASGRRGSIAKGAFSRPPPSLAASACCTGSCGLWPEGRLPISSHVHASPPSLLRAPTRTIRMSTHAGEANERDDASDDGTGLADSGELSGDGDDDNADPAQLMDGIGRRVPVLREPQETLAVLVAVPSRDWDAAVIPTASERAMSPSVRTRPAPSASLADSRAPSAAQLHPLSGTGLPHPASLSFLRTDAPTAALRWGTCSVDLCEWLAGLHRTITCAPADVEALVRAQAAVETTTPGCQPAAGDTSEAVSPAPLPYALRQLWEYKPPHRCPRARVGALVAASASRPALRSLLTGDPCAFRPLPPCAVAALAAIPGLATKAQSRLMPPPVACVPPLPDALFQSQPPPPVLTLPAARTAPMDTSYISTAPMAPPKLLTDAAQGLRTLWTTAPVPVLLAIAACVRPAAAQALRSDRKGSALAQLHVLGTALPAAVERAVELPRPTATDPTAQALASLGQQLLGQTPPKMEVVTTSTTAPLPAAAPLTLGLAPPVATMAANVDSARTAGEEPRVPRSLPARMVHGLTQRERAARKTASGASSSAAANAVGGRERVGALEDADAALQQQRAAEDIKLAQARRAWLLAEAQTLRHVQGLVTETRSNSVQTNRPLVMWEHALLALFGSRSALGTLALPRPRVGMSPPAHARATVLSLLAHSPRSSAPLLPTMASERARVRMHVDRPASVQQRPITTTATTTTVTTPSVSARASTKADATTTARRVVRTHAQQVSPRAATHMRAVPRGNSLFELHYAAVASATPPRSPTYPVVLRIVQGLLDLTRVGIVTVRRPDTADTASIERVAPTCRTRPQPCPPFPAHITPNAAFLRRAVRVPPPPPTSGRVRVSTHLRALAQPKRPAPAPAVSSGPASALSSSSRADPPLARVAHTSIDTPPRLASPAPLAAYSTPAVPANARGTPRAGRREVTVAVVVEEAAVDAAESAAGSGGADGAGADSTQRRPSLTATALIEMQRNAAVLPAPPPPSATPSPRAPARAASPPVVTAPTSSAVTHAPTPPSPRPPSQRVRFAAHVAVCAPDANTDTSPLVVARADCAEPNPRALFSHGFPALHTDLDFSHTPPSPSCSPPAAPSPAVLSQPLPHLRPASSPLASSCASSPHSTPPSATHSPVPSPSPCSPWPASPRALSPLPSPTVAAPAPAPLGPSPTASPPHSPTRSAAAAQPSPTVSTTSLASAASTATISAVSALERARASAGGELPQDELVITLVSSLLPGDAPDACPEEDDSAAISALLGGVEEHLTRATPQPASPQPASEASEDDFALLQAALACSDDTSLHTQPPPLSPPRPTAPARPAPLSGLPLPSRSLIDVALAAFAPSPARALAHTWSTPSLAPSPSGSPQSSPALSPPARALSTPDASLAPPPVFAEVRDETGGLVSPAQIHEQASADAPVNMRLEPQLEVCVDTADTPVASMTNPSITTGAPAIPATPPRAPPREPAQPSAQSCSLLEPRPSLVPPLPRLPSRASLSLGEIAIAAATEAANTVARSPRTAPTAPHPAPDWSTPPASEVTVMVLGARAAAPDSAEAAAPRDKGQQLDAEPGLLRPPGSLSPLICTPDVLPRVLVSPALRDAALPRTIATPRTPGFAIASSAGSLAHPPANDPFAFTPTAPVLPALLPMRPASRQALPSARSEHILTSVRPISASGPRADDKLDARTQLAVSAVPVPLVGDASVGLKPASTAEPVLATASTAFRMLAITNAYPATSAATASPAQLPPLAQRAAMHYGTGSTRFVHRRLAEVLRLRREVYQYSKE